MVPLKLARAFLYTYPHVSIRIWTKIALQIQETKIYKYDYFDINLARFNQLTEQSIYTASNGYLTPDLLIGSSRASAETNNPSIRMRPYAMWAYRRLTHGIYTAVNASTKLYQGVKLV